MTSVSITEVMTRKVVMISESESVLTEYMIQDLRVTYMIRLTSHDYSDSAVRTSVLDYAVAAIINRQSIRCMIHMILNEYDSVTCY